MDATRVDARIYSHPGDHLFVVTDAPLSPRRKAAILAGLVVASWAPIVAVILAVR